MPVVVGFWRVSAPPPDRAVNFSTDVSDTLATARIGVPSGRNIRYWMLSESMTALNGTSRAPQPNVTVGGRAAFLPDALTFASIISSSVEQTMVTSPCGESESSNSRSIETFWGSAPPNCGPGGCAWPLTGFIVHLLVRVSVNSLGLNQASTLWCVSDSM